MIMMKDLKTLLKEASEIAKKNQIDITKNILMKGQSLKNIKCFGILLSPDPDIIECRGQKKVLCDFEEYLKQNFMKYLSVEGQSGGNEKCCYILFNVRLDNMKERFAGRYEHGSFFYCYPDDEGNLICEYYQKEYPEKPFDRLLNEYQLVNKTLAWENKADAPDYYTIEYQGVRYTVDPSMFIPVNDKISENLRMASERFKTTPDDVMDFALNRVGQKASYLKQLVNL